LKDKQVSRISTLSWKRHALLRHAHMLTDRSNCSRDTCLFGMRISRTPYEDALSLSWRFAVELACRRILLGGGSPWPIG
jgi:hypothetical protein